MARPAKKDLFLQLLETAPEACLRFDARRPDVMVPAGFKNEAALMLSYGLNFPVPMTDFVVSDIGVQATLSFNRVPLPTFVPWSAVFVVQDLEKGVVYEEDVPADVTVHTAENPPPPTKLGVVEGGGETGGSEERGYPALRLVK